MRCQFLLSLCYLSATLAGATRQSPTSLVTRQDGDLVTRAAQSLDPAATADAYSRRNSKQSVTFASVPNGGRGSGHTVQNNIRSSSSVKPKIVQSAASKSAEPAITTKTSPSATPAGTPNKTTPSSVSSTRSTNNPSAAAQAQAFDKTATRLLESVTLQSSSGLCLSIDPNAGDSSENLIPITLVPCADTPGEKFDIITKGKHNDGTHKDGVLVVSSLMNGCISFDGQRRKGDKVNMFSCGGKADGSGGTDLGQLVSFSGGQDRRNMNITFAPLSEEGRVCFKGGRRSGRLVAGRCNGKPSRNFKVLLI